MSEPGSELVRLGLRGPGVWRRLVEAMSVAGLAVVLGWVLDRLEDRVWSLVAQRMVLALAMAVRPLERWPRPW